MVKAIQDEKGKTFQGTSKESETSQGARLTFLQQHSQIVREEVSATSWPRRTLTGKREVRALLVPSISSEEEMGSDPPVFVAGQVLVRTVLRVEPLFGDELRRWYVPEEYIEEVKGLQRPFRMQALDGALAVLRGW